MPSDWTSFYLGYSFIHDEIVPRDLPGEVYYHFVKGHGWVPETPLSLAAKSKTRQAAKSANFGWGVNYSDAENRIYREMLERMDRPRSTNVPYTTMNVPRAEYSTNTVPRATNTVPRTTNTVSIGNGNNYYVYDETPPAREVVNRTMQNAVGRYYPGSGEAAREDTENTETTHERRVREYREAQARARRGR